MVAKKHDNVFFSHCFFVWNHGTPIGINRDMVLDNGLRPRNPLFQLKLYIFCHEHRAVLADALVLDV